MFGKKQPESEPTVEWVTGTPGLVETYPILPARKAMPEWFKASTTKISTTKAHGHPSGPESPNAVPGPHDLPTIRACPGIVDVLRAGYLMRAWTDIQIDTLEPARGDETDQYRSLTSMSPNETGGKTTAFGPGLNQMLPLWPNEYAFALKLDSPWACRTPPGWSMLFMPVPYDDKKPYRILPGITDTDNFHVVNLLAMWDHHGSYVIEAGTPLCWFLPVRREGFQMNTKVSYEPDRVRVLMALGKGGVGEGARLIHGSYVKERIKRQRQD